MHLGVFAATLGTEAGGMETYETSYLRSLAKLRSEHSVSVFGLNDHIKEKLAIPDDPFTYEKLKSSNRWLAMTMGLPMALAKSSIDIFHPTYVPPFFCPKPYVYTVHSSVTWTHPHFYPNKIRWRVNYLQEKGIREARMLLCVSEHTKNYVAERFKVPESRLAVVYHGVSEHFKPRAPEEYSDRLKERYGLEGKYFLFAGKLKENKNISGLVKAHRQFVQETGSDTKLVLVGRRLWNQGTIDDDLDYGVQSGLVIELGHIEHEDMPLLYNSARGLVFPSFWEGFGIPILEAQASGVPVLTSNNSSMPEAAGGEAVLVDPYSIEEMAAGMESLDQDEKLREKLIAGGLANASKFTWEGTARETLSAYERSL